MIRTPLISVVMPAYNHERYVRQALDSLLDSGLPELEVLICDDASTDATPAIIDRWADANAGKLSGFKFIRHASNTGSGTGMNELVAEARGEIIHAVASDDFYLPGGLARKTRAMLDNPRWAGAFCDAMAVGLDGQVYYDSLMQAGTLDPERLQSPAIVEELFYRWQEPANLISWRRSAFRIHGGGFEFDSTLFCEDFDFAWWALGRGALGYIPEVCYAYRWRSLPQTRPGGDPAREARDIASVLARNAPNFPPDLARQMRNRALTLNHAAAGDALSAAPLLAEFLQAEANSRTRPANPRYQATLEEGVDFRKPGYPYFLSEVSGMSEYEPWGRWTDSATAPAARFRFRQALPAKFTVEITALAYGPNVGEPVKLSAGGVEKSFVIFARTEADTYRVAFETDGAAHTLEFVPPRPTRPIDVDPKLGDARTLGIAFVSLKIKG